MRGRTDFKPDEPDAAWLKADYRRMLADARREMAGAMRPGPGAFEALNEVRRLLDQGEDALRRILDAERTARR